MTKSEEKSCTKIDARTERAQRRQRAKQKTLEENVLQVAKWKRQAEKHLER